MNFDRETAIKTTLPDPKQKKKGGAIDYDADDDSSHDQDDRTNKP